MFRSREFLRTERADGEAGSGEGEPDEAESGEAESDGVGQRDRAVARTRAEQGRFRAEFQGRRQGAGGKYRLPARVCLWAAAGGSASFPPRRAGIQDAQTGQRQIRGVPCRGAESVMIKRYEPNGMGNRRSRHCRVARRGIRVDRIG